MLSLIKFLGLERGKLVWSYRVLLGSNPLWRGCEYAQAIAAFERCSLQLKVIDWWYWHLDSPAQRNWERLAAAHGVASLFPTWTWAYRHFIQKRVPFLDPC